ncbi:hypothetical protein SKAU_G00151840 [Synaphobranchus kaupii]|uniref:Uncharacterized protein n=1 Tax=Synaphobranchus kaupii TaxID=118154 RepID=A0A9Q1FH45_SYNKA|nr:hypothetical protein SKAU_G00151840 [Synaphobranchus kaupii]
MQSHPSELSSHSLAKGKLQDQETCQAAPLKTIFSQKYFADTQQEILGMQRRILAAGAEDITEIGPCQNTEELQQLDKELENKEKRTNMQVRADLWTGLGHLQSCEKQPLHNRVSR